VPCSAWASVARLPLLALSVLSLRKVPGHVGQRAVVEGAPSVIERRLPARSGCGGQTTQPIERRGRVLAPADPMQSMKAIGRASEWDETAARFVSPSWIERRRQPMVRDGERRSHPPQLRGRKSYDRFFLGGSVSRMAATPKLDGGTFARSAINIVIPLSPAQFDELSGDLAELGRTLGLPPSASNADLIIEAVHRQARSQ
jgi:hypothetical protein